MLLGTACGGPQPVGPPDLPGDDSECRTFRTAIEVVWNQDVGRRVETRFNEVGGQWAEQAFLRVRTNMDALSEDWVRLSELACVDYLERGGSAQVYHLKRACFDDALGQLRATSLLLQEADSESARRAHSALASWDLDRCVHAAVFQTYGIDVASAADEDQRRVAELAERARAARAFGRFERAVELGMEASRGAREAENVRLEAAALLELGWAHLALDQYDQAGEAFGEARRIATVAEHPTALAESLHGLGVVAMHRGQFDESLRLHGEGLEIRRGLAATPDPPRAMRAALAESHNFTGRTLREQGNASDATAAFERALEILRSTYGEDHPRVAAMLANVGIGLLDQGNAEGAVQRLRAALQIDERLLGEHHPDVGADLNTLAVALARSGEAAPAREAVQRALTIATSALGENHRDVARAHNTLGMILAAADEHEDALREFQAALGVNTQVLGDEHVDVARSLANVARTARDAGQRALARESARRAVDIFRALLPQGAERTRTEALLEQLE